MRIDRAVDPPLARLALLSLLALVTLIVFPFPRTLAICCRSLCFVM